MTYKTDKKAAILLSLGFICATLQAQETTKTVVVLPTQDTTIITFKTNTTVSSATTTTTYSSEVRPTLTAPPVIPPSSTARKNLVLDWNAASPLKSFTLANQQYCCNYSITEVNSPDGMGSKVIRFDLRNNDPIVSSSRRAEVQTNTDVPQESEAWYGVKYWFEKYDIDAGAESILQWHDKDGTTPPLSIQIQSGRLRLMQSFTSGNIPTDIGPVVTGQWVSFVLHVIWTTSANGLVEVWQNGNKIISRKGRTNSTGGSYLKNGINKWSWAPGGGSSTSTQRIFYEVQFRQASKDAVFKDVTPD